MENIIYKENKKRTHVKFRSIKDLIQLIGENRIYNELESKGNLILEGYMVIADTKALVSCHAPHSVSIGAYSYENSKNSKHGDSYPALIVVEGNTLRESFDGLIKLINEKGGNN